MNFMVRNGYFGYSRSKQILQNVNLGVDDGQVLCILGPNGVGKTTLLRCMMGMLPWQSGATYLDGQELSLYPEREIWKRIAYVPQARGLSFAFTALELVMMGRSSHIGLLRQPKAEDQNAAMEALRECGVDKLKDTKCTRMSGGELQMVLIARALAIRPKMLVFDEPESNLDFRNQLVVLQTIRGLVKEKGLSAIVNTHYPEHAMRIADRALLLHRDGTNESGPVGEVLTEGRLSATFDVNVHIQRFEWEGKSYTDVVPVSLI